MCVQINIGYTVQQPQTNSAENQTRRVTFTARIQINNQCLNTVQKSLQVLWGERTGHMCNPCGCSGHIPFLITPPTLEPGTIQVDSSHRLLCFTPHPLLPATVVMSSVQRWASRPGRRSGELSCSRCTAVFYGYREPEVGWCQCCGGQGGWDARPFNSPSQSFGQVGQMEVVHLIHYTESDVMLTSLFFCF